MQKKIDVFLATSSEGKIKQIKEAAHAYYQDKYGIKTIPIRFRYVTERTDLHVVEDEDTLVGNCYKKVTEYGDKYGFWTIADDSGFFVSALNLCPGVHSHRDGWTPKKVMKEMRGKTNRYAFIQTCAMLYRPNLHGKGETRFTVTKTLEGTVVDRMPRSFGYGYDGIFSPASVAPATVQQVLKSAVDPYTIDRVTLEYPRTMAMIAIFATLDMCVNS